MCGLGCVRRRDDAVGRGHGVDGGLQGDGEAGPAGVGPRCRFGASASGISGRLPAADFTSDPFQAGWFPHAYIDPSGRLQGR